MNDQQSEQEVLERLKHRLERMKERWVRLLRIPEEQVSGEAGE